MRPSTPRFQFTTQAGPSSPPPTPTTTTSKPAFNFGKNRRHGFILNNYDPLDTEHDGTITPTGVGNTFSYNRFSALSELSPRSSSPGTASNASGEGDTDEDSIPPRSRSSSRSRHPSPLPRRVVLSTGNFTVEECGPDDYASWDSEDIIRPSHYEDAESERARSPRRPGTPPRSISPILNDFATLNCDPEDAEDEREIWLRKQKEEKRRKRRSSGVSKRSHAQSVGSDTDEEDLLPMLEGINEIGSSARRLRRKVGDRASLIFDDPPARIDELEEPESCEEVVEIEDGEEQGVDRNLPYYVQEDMDVDDDDE